LSSGAPGTAPAAMVGTGRFSSMFAAKVVTEMELSTAPLSSYDIVVLSDTSDPGPAMRESLQKFVHAGGLLIVFPGGRTNAQQINEALGENGAKLLPATFGQPVKLATADQLAEGISFAPEYQRNPVLQLIGAA